MVKMAGRNAPGHAQFSPKRFSFKRGKDTDGMLV
jgi:hypothetical protein